MHDNICKICGRHFQSRWPSTLCSEACARENSRRWQRMHKRSNLHGLDKVPETSTEEHTSLGNKVAAAKLMGLTYGQYMAARRFGAVFPGVM